MLSDDEILLQARTLDGRRMFYPPFQHPVLARVREQLKSLENEPETYENVMMKGFLTRDLCVFEIGEDRAKHAYLERERTRLGR